MIFARMKSEVFIMSMAGLTNVLDVFLQNKWLYMLPFQEHTVWSVYVAIPRTLFEVSNINLSTGHSLYYCISGQCSGTRWWSHRISVAFTINTRPNPIDMYISYDEDTRPNFNFQGGCHVGYFVWRDFLFKVAAWTGQFLLWETVYCLSC